MAAPPDLGAVLRSLRKEYPEVQAPAFADPFELVLLENVGYLVPDEHRQQVWDDLRARIGTSPVDLMAAAPEVLLEVLRPGGMHPERRADKVRTCCAILLEEFGGRFDAILALPTPQRRRALKRFPGFGDPGADKVLLLTGTEKVLALDSNGLRVLLRLGYGQESKNYAQSYRSAQRAATAALPQRIDALQRAHLLLRRHGQAVCKNTRPACSTCALRPGCATGRQ